MSLRFKKSFTFSINNQPFRSAARYAAEKLHVKYNTIHLSRQQDETLILLEISAIFGFVQCFCGLRRICFGAFSDTGAAAFRSCALQCAAIDGGLPAGVY